VLLITLSNCTKTNNPVTQSNLIANYPLISDCVDKTGLNADMMLQNAPFENGGTYSNGIYDYSSDPNSCIIRSPTMDSLKFKSFSISMDFFASVNRTQPVWVIGRGCRWLGFYLQDDGTVSLLYNNANSLATKTTYSLNVWHNAKISFDGITVKIFLDSNLAASLDFGTPYVELNYAGCGLSDTEIGVTNYSNGDVFKGYVRNLLVYSPQ
jgi:hypothetical protein